MPYTNPWSNTIPLGTALANGIDSYIQQLRLDIYERVNTLIGTAGDMDDDPVIDGTTAKSLTDLVAALATKTTLSGLAAGQLLKASSATTLASSSVSEAAATQLLTAVATKSNGILGGAGSGYATLFNAPKTGLMLVVVNVESTNNAQCSLKFAGNIAAYSGLKGQNGSMYYTQITALRDVVNADAISIANANGDCFYNYIYFS